MKSITYPIRFKKDEYEKLMAEAKRRGKTFAELIRDLVTYGLPALPPVPDKDWNKLISDTWDSLGPPPTVNYDEIESR